MKTVQFGQKVDEPVVVCLGYFGCLHKGHIAVIDQAKKLATRQGARLALFTFSGNKLRKSSLFTFEERLELYSKMGVEIVLYADFTPEFAAISGAEFVRELTLNVKLTGVCCGFDYSFGSDRLSAKDLGRLLTDNVELCITDCVMADGQKISSTHIAELVEQNKIIEANELLCELYCISGTVTTGRHVGRRLGFPTANLLVQKDKLLPTGVFGGFVQTATGVYKCIVNIGAKPTYGIASPTVEAYLLDFDGNLYGQKITLYLTRFLRPIRKFDSENELILQIERDKQAVKND